MTRHHAKAIDGAPLAPHHRKAPTTLPAQTVREVMSQVPRAHLIRPLTDAELRVVASAVDVPRLSLAARAARALRAGWAAARASWEVV